MYHSWGEHCAPQKSLVLHHFEGLAGLFFDLKIFGTTAEKTKTLSFEKSFLQLHHTNKVMSKEQTAAQVQEEDDEPDEWYVVSNCQARPKLY